MSKYTIIFYAIIVGVAILSSLLKKSKKKQNQQKTQYQPKPKTNYQPPVQKTYTPPPPPTSTQPKSLEDILEGLLKQQNTPVVPPPQKVENTMVSDKKEILSPPSVENASLEEVNEEKYYGFDTELEYDEEVEDYDRVEDHHVHGKGFDNIEEVLAEPEEPAGEFAEIDWRKAVITAEILKRPNY